MSEDQKENGNKPAMVLPKVLDISSAGMLKNSLLSVIVDGATVELDAEQVQRVTTPCLQVLASAAKHSEVHGGELRIINVPDEFRSAVQILGLGEILGITEA